jgi:NAD(P)-dependent dehydrogenase (short-subunit alcohol dehydrogenase family)
MPNSASRTALVVGASRGLGLGLAVELKSRGWRVTGTVRDDAGASRLADAGIDVERLDTADPAMLASLRQRLDAKIWDLVFINAGVGGPAHQDAAQATEEEIGRLFLVNAVAPIATARAFADRMRQRTGVIAFMSSDLGNVSHNEDGFIELYRASKAALNSLIRSFTAKLATNGITVLAMHPGWVRTEMGGPHAPLAIEDSVPGLADALERYAGTGLHRFVDYTGAELAW